ncbi:helix-turn-helix DNA binding protein [Gordonia phage Octobien14]|uniref:Helix-turn-helix DNA binding protein n=1 Tax=Gordonia phage Octobien14 TaxID=2483673 RepID=A0A3G3MAY6_9CAUD|nr:helix-turn-helix DNA binding protein [Gordonia phage Octobien14]AYR03238.1 helix-turn-helix DNA binding protein [Gordonia phage Octobien14]
MWLDEDSAVKYVGRSRRTLRWWYQMGIVQRRKHRERWQYDSLTLDAAKARQEHNYEFRPIKPGLGGAPNMMGGRRKPEGMDPLF